MHWYLDVLKKYAVFNGRARRQEYWMFTLFNAIILVVLAIISAAIHSPIIYFIYTVAVILPSLAAVIRRLHDTGKSGWWIFIGIVPLVGSIVLLVFLCKEGERTTNSYGPDPKTTVGQVVGAAAY